MPDASVELRVYCVCGQKMKVTEDMFGLPAKCVACRRKIRIPSHEEIGDDVREVHLKDHPEFLRKVKKSRQEPVFTVPTKAAAPDVLPEPVCASEHAHRVHELQRPLPLDTLPQLQQIASVRNKIQRFLRRPDSETVPAKETLEACLAKADTARAYLDKCIRVKKSKSASELSAVREKIVQTALLARLDEINFSTYQNMVDRLRAQRDRLERLLYNTDAWLDVRDPRAAGGYVSRDVEDVPEPGFEIQWPEPPQEENPLIEQHLRELRAAFEMRDRCKQKLEESANLRSKGEVPSAAMAELRAQTKIDKRRAEAEIIYRRKRLEEFGRDTAGDAQTIHACLDRARKRLREGVIDNAAFEALEHELARGQRECARTHDVVTRALIAECAADVPEVKPAAGDRSAPEKKAPAGIPLAPVLNYPDRGLGPDSWLAWLAALLLAVSVFVPLYGKLSPVQASKALAFEGSHIYWLGAAPILAGALLAALGAVPRRKIRGWLLLAAWVALTVAAVFVVHESHYSPSAAAERLHNGPYWLLRPGAIIMALAGVLVLAAACLALCTSRKNLLAIAGALLVAVAAGMAAASDSFGRLKVQPSLAVDANQSKEVSVTVTNTGARDMLLTSEPLVARNAFVYKLQRQVGPEWIDVPVQNVESPTLGTAVSFRVIELGQNGNATFRYQLEPGKYRARLVNHAEIFQPLVSELVIAEPEQPEPVEPPAPAMPDPIEANVDVAAQTEIPAAPTAEPQAEIELRGTLVGPSGEPRFSLVLHLPGQAPESIDGRLGDKILAQWVVSEYNRSRQTLTLTSETNVIVLNRGKRVPLIASPPVEAPQQP